MSLAQLPETPSQAPAYAGAPSSVVTTQDDDQGGIRRCACGVLFRPKKWNQRSCSRRCTDRAYNAAHPVARQQPLDFSPPEAPFPPVRDQRVPRKERRRLCRMSRTILVRLQAGPATNRELAELFPAGAAWRTRLSDLRFWLRGGNTDTEPIPHHDCGGGLVYYWLEGP